MFSAVFLFSVGIFCRFFLDIVRYACKISNENTLNIKQQYRLNSNDRFGFKPQFFIKSDIHRIFIFYTSNRDLSAKTLRKMSLILCFLTLQSVNITVQTAENTGGRRSAKIIP